MPSVHHACPERAQPCPARGHHTHILVPDHRLHGEIPGEALPRVEHERHAVVRVPGRRHHRAGDADRREQPARLIATPHHVPFRHDLRVVIGGLDVPSHRRDRDDLRFPHEQRHAARLEVLRRAGVIDVVVRRETVADLGERDPRAPEVVQQFGDHARPAEVHEQARPTCADHPEVGGAVADVHDRDRRDRRIPSRA